jgi:hypothetical protein
MDECGGDENTGEETGLFFESTDDKTGILHSPGMCDHGDANAMDLFIPLCLFDDFFERVGGPVYPDEGLASGSVLAGAREAAEMASSQTSLLIVEEQIQSFQFCVAMKQSLLETQCEGSSKGGLNIRGTLFSFHIVSPAVEKILIVFFYLYNIP